MTKSNWDRAMSQEPGDKICQLVAEMEPYPDGDYEKTQAYWEHLHTDMGVIIDKYDVRNKE